MKEKTKLSSMTDKEKKVYRKEKTPIISAARASSTGKCSSVKKHHRNAGHLYGV